MLKGEGCHGEGRVRENLILFKVRENSGSFVSGQGISKSLFKVKEKVRKLYLKVAADYFVRSFVIDKAIWLKKLSEPSLF